MIFTLYIFLIFLPGCTAEPVETNLLLPVEFTNIPEDMVLTYFHTDKIQIRIQASPKLMERISKETILYPADLYTDLAFDPAGDSNTIETGTYVLPVHETRIPMDPAIKILDITPPYLSVRLEKKVTRTFAVTVPYTGEPAKGKLALAPACAPPFVELTGPETMLDRIEILQTKPVDLTGASEIFKKKVPLDLDSPLLFSSSADMFTVTVPIHPKQVSKTLSNLPIRLVNSPPGAKVEPQAISLEIKGPFEALSSKAVLDQIYAFIDLEGMGSGVYARHAYINVPVDLVMTKADPQVFTLEID